MVDHSRLNPSLWFTLYELMKIGSGRGTVRISTTKLSEIIGLSQQSASRHLQILEHKGFISRQMDSGGSFIKITEEGMVALEEVYRGLKVSFEVTGEELNFEGIVFSGMLQGAYYISQLGYREQIQDKLGFDPYPGTLNLRLRGDYIEDRRNLEGWPSIFLVGFMGEERAFGGARCYPVLVNGEEEGALIIAERTSYDLGVMEIISPVNLRDRFELRDGDVVRLTFLESMNDSLTSNQNSG